MRIICLLLSILLGQFANSQSLVIEKVDMSTGDASIPLEIIGNSSFHELAAISATGSVYSYDGRELKPWSDKKIDNAQFFEHIYIDDSLLYAEVEGKYYQFNSKSNFPIKLSKSAVPSSALTSWESLSSDQTNFFELTYSTLSWTNKSAPFKTSTHTEAKRAAVISSWGTPYLIINQALNRVNPSPTSFFKNFLDHNNQYPIKQFTSVLSTIFLYPTSFYNPTYSRHIPLPQDIQSPKNILNILPPLTIQHSSTKINAQPSHGPSTIPALTQQQSLPNNSSNIQCLLFTKTDIYLYNDNKWVLLKHNIKPTSITSFHITSSTLSISTSTSGIYTADIPSGQSSSITLVPHKLNSKLKEYEFIALHLINNTLYYFTRKNGIISISDRQLRIIKTRKKVDQVIPSSSTTLLIHEDGSTSTLSEPDKTTQDLEFVIPDYNRDIIAGQKVLSYKLKDSLFTYDIANKSLHKIQYNLPINKACFRNSQLLTFIERDLHTTYPLANLSSQAPKLVTAYITTAKNKKIEIYPSKKEIQLTTEDYPITFLAEAKFLKNPAKIEYQYSWKNPNVKKSRFSFNENHTLRTKLIGSAQAVLTLKSEGDENTFLLAPINTTRVQGNVDYSAIIYMGIAIISLLTLALLLGYFRNRKQKKKIAQLLNQQRLMEMEQKALQLQMNPHFIFNSLNGVKGMIALGKTKNAKEYLTKISGWMRNMLNDARKNKILVKDEAKNLGLYMDIERELRGGAFNYEVVDETQGEIYIPSMMIQPFIENSIVHAFNGQQENPTITLYLTQKGKKVVVKIEDNGRGMVEKKVSHKSVAMNLIQERLSLWDQGKNTYNVNVVNKELNSHHSTGVIIELTLPIMD